MPAEPSEAQDIIDYLELEHHPSEGGYFKRTYTSNSFLHNSRPMMSSIYYLLTRVEAVGYMHRNASDIMHYYHQGGAIKYLLMDDEFRLSNVTLGPDLAAGHSPQLLVPSGVWKASQLAHSASFSLISEAVCPGFEYSGNQLASADLLQSAPAAVRDKLLRFIAPGA